MKESGLSHEAGAELVIQVLKRVVQESEFLELSYQVRRLLGVASR